MLKNLMLLLVECIGMHSIALAQWSGANTTTDGAIYRSGNVGIGLTTNPSTKLHIHSDATDQTTFRIDNTSLPGGLQYLNLASYGSNGVGDYWTGFNTRNTGSIYYNGLFVLRSAIGLIFSGSSTSEHMRIIPSGNVGIGNQNPQYKLTVGGEINWANSILGGDQGGSIELGSATSTAAGSGTSFIDFHYRGIAQDYNTRIINDENGRLSLVANDLYTNSNVGIGSIPDAAYKLSVKGKVRADEIKVYTTWSDYVFNDDYKLKPLAEVEQYIKVNQHLPDIPSAADVEKEGINLGK